MKTSDLSEKDQKAFEDFLGSIRRIRKRTERDVKAAIKKFRRGFKNKKIAYTPPAMELTDPKLCELV